METSRREKEPKWNAPQPLTSKELRTNFWNHWKENDWTTAKPLAEDGCTEGDESNSGNEKIDNAPGARR